MSDELVTVLMLFQNILTTRITYSMAQQPLKSFDRPLLRVSLSDSILVTLIEAE
jgi:hypothetical protein